MGCQREGADQSEVLNVQRGHFRPLGAVNGITVVGGEEWQ
jgi:hypothetical protein